MTAYYKNPLLVYDTSGYESELLLWGVAWVMRGSSLRGRGGDSLLFQPRLSSIAALSFSSLVPPTLCPIQVAVTKGTPITLSG